MSSDDDGKIIMYSALGFGAGIYCFFKGFKIFREYRVLADTPEVPIRSMAMGLVEIHGKAKPVVADRLASSPVTSTPCLFYKVDIERYQRDSKGNGSWRHYKTDTFGVPFHLDDGSGKVLVNPFGAEYDLNPNCRCETSRGVINLSSFFGSSKTSAVPAPRPRSDSELIAYAEAAHSGGGSLFASIGTAALTGLSTSGSGGRFRFTEYCVIPERWYDVTGTCSENPHPQGTDDRNLITKGENEPTFVISWRSEKGVESHLRWRALKYIFGGAALAVVCLGIILAKLGWL